MSEEKIASKYIDKDPPMGTEQQLERKNNDYLAYLKEKLNFILATYGRRLTDADGHVNELIRTAAEFAIRLSQKVNGDEIISAINASPEQITISANKINLNGTTIVNGSLVTTFQIIYDHNDYSQTDIDTMRQFILGQISFTDAQWEKYSINGDGVMRMSDLIKVRNMIIFARDIVKTVTVTINPEDTTRAIKVETSTASPTDSGSGTSTEKWVSYYDGECARVPRGRFTTVNASYIGNYVTETPTNIYGKIFPNQSINKSVGLQSIEDFVAGQGTTDGWVWRRWSSGVWEGWKTVSVTLSKSSGWAAWGNIFQSATIKRQSLPVTLAAGHYEFVTSHATQDWSSWAVVLDPPTTTQTGSYILCRGTRPSDTAVFALDYYVRGVVA